MAAVKVKFGTEIRRINIEDGTSYDEFRALISQLFPNLNQNENFSFSYDDGSNGMVLLCNSNDLMEAMRVAKSLKPPILRINMIPDGPLVLEENGSSASLSNSEFSNWGKKLKMEEDENIRTNPTEHVVKICGVPFNAGNRQGQVPIKNYQSPPTTPVSQSPPTTTQIQPSVTSTQSQLKKKTIRDTVVEESGIIHNKSLKWSEEAAYKTALYSESILEGTLPLSQTIHQLSLNTANMSERLTNSPNIDYPTNNNDEIVNNLSFRQDQYSRDTISKLDQLAEGVNQSTGPLYEMISSQCNDYAEKSIQMVNEYTQHVIDLVEDARSKVNTDVNIEFKPQIDNYYSINVQNQVDTYSTNTTNKLSNIADDIVRNIMEI